MDRLLSHKQRRALGQAYEICAKAAIFDPGSPNEIASMLTSNNPSQIAVLAP
jgi:hypothetical protein